MQLKFLKVFHRKETETMARLTPRQGRLLLSWIWCVFPTEMQDSLERRA